MLVIEVHGLLIADNATSSQGQQPIAQPTSKTTIIAQRAISCSTLPQQEKTRIIIPEQRTLTSSRLPIFSLV